MPDEETREILQVGVIYTILVRDLDGHPVRLEPGGQDTVMWPFGRSLDDKVSAKLKEIEKGPVQG